MSHNLQVVERGKYYRGLKDILCPDDSFIITDAYIIEVDTAKSDKTIADPYTTKTVEGVVEKLYSNSNAPTLEEYLADMHRKARLLRPDNKSK
jgi:hypothetical protein